MGRLLARINHNGFLQGRVEGSEPGDPGVLVEAHQRGQQPVGRATINDHALFVWDGWEGQWLWLEVCEPILRKMNLEDGIPRPLAGSESYFIVLLWPFAQAENAASSPGAKAPLPCRHAPLI